MNYGPVLSTAMAIELMGMAASNPRAAVQKARKALGAASPRERSILHRVIGVAERSMSNPATSLKHLNRSIDLADELADSELGAKGRLSRALTRNMLGSTEEALDDLTIAERNLSGLDAADVRFQRGSILLQLGRLNDALRDFDAALPVFASSSNRVWEADLLANRGIVLTYQGQLSRAEGDLSKALKIFNHEEAAAASADTLFNLGFLRGRMGDLVDSLAAFEDAERRMVDLGHPVAELPGDRAEVLLLSGLAAEAVKLTQRSAVVQEQRGLALLQAESLLLESRAHLVDGRPDEAVVVAETAQSLFTKQGREGWASQAAILGIRARLDAETTQPEDLVLVEQQVERLRSHGQMTAAKEASILMSQLAVRAGDLELADRSLSDARSLRRSGSVEAKAQYWLAEAEAHLARERSKQAALAAYAGIRAVGRYRALLGATDVRTHISSYSRQLSELGLRLAIDARRPRRVMLWTELGRASALDAPPVRPQSDPLLEEDLRALRLAAARVAQAELAMEPSDRDRAEQARIQRRVLRRSRTLGRTNISDVVTVEDLSALADALGEDLAMISFGECEEQLYGVVVRRGRFSLHILGEAEPTRRAAEHLRFSARRLALSPSPSGLADHQDAARDLDRLLFGSLPLPDGPLVLSPPPWLFDIGWSALPTVDGRPISVTPSARIWAKARAAARQSDTRVVAVAGPRLAHADTEARLVGSLHGGSTVLTGAEATVPATLQHLEGASIAHIVCHGLVTRQNPMFSSLELADGPLTIYELERLRQPPRFVVLSACDGGSTAVRPGGELMGFAASLLSMGSSVVVASGAPVVDSVLTLALMERFHRSIIAGRRPAQALMAASAANHPDPVYGAAARSFICLGDG